MFKLWRTMDTATALALCLFISLLIFTLLFRPKLKGALNIPGPNAVEVFLNFHKFGTVDFHKLLAKWSEKYGEFFQYSIFGQRVVVASSPEFLKALFNDEERVSYPPNFAFEAYTDGKYGITGTTGKYWHEQRKIVSLHFKKSGFRGSSGIAHVLDQDLDELFAHLDNNADGTAIDIQKTFQIPIMNVIMRITTGSVFPKDFNDIVLQFESCFGSTTRSKFLMLFGRLVSSTKYEPKYLQGLRKSARKFWRFLDGIIEERVKFPHANNFESPDVVDSFVAKMNEDSSSIANVFHEKVGLKNLRATLLDLNLPGAGTPYHMWNYMLLHLAVNQEIQEKIRYHVDSIVGMDRKPDLDDRKRLPYVEACIHEMIREFSVSPLAFHANHKESLFQNHVIPAGTLFIGNLWGCNHSTVMWKDPFVLKPERFLNEDGTAVSNTEQIMSFGAGRRKCVGELVSKDLLFLLLCRLVQKYKLWEHPDHPILNLEPVAGLFLQMPNFKVLLVQRVNE